MQDRTGAARPGRTRSNPWKRSKPPLGVRRVADLRLRGEAGTIPVRVRWPRSRSAPPIVVFLPDAAPADGVSAEDDALGHELCSRVGAVVLCVPWAPRQPGALDRAEAALMWAADHGDELGADPGRLVVAGHGAGAAAAAALALRAHDRGWPPLRRQVLILNEGTRRPASYAAASAPAAGAPVPGHPGGAERTLRGVAARDGRRRRGGARPRRPRDLVARGAGGAMTEATFRALMAPHRGPLHGHCRRMLGSDHDAEDAMQEVMLRAWRALPSFEGRCSLRSWLYRIATNTCLTALDKRPARALPLEGDEEWPLDAELNPTAAGYEQQEAAARALTVTLQHLPAKQRAALILRDVLGFRASEAASTLGTSRRVGQQRAAAGPRDRRRLPRAEQLRAARRRGRGLRARARAGGRGHRDRHRGRHDALERAVLDLLAARRLLIS